MIPALVLQEVVWVLLRSYKVPKPDVLMALRGLLDTPPFEVLDRDLVEEAMRRWQEGPGDFSDYLIRASARGCHVVLTFDQALLREVGFEAP